MRFPRGAALASLVTTSLCAFAAPAPADVSGGALAPSSPLAGGTEYGAPVAVSQRPVVSELSFPAAATAGRPPRLVLRIDEPGVATVDAQVKVISLSTHRALITVKLGWVHTSRSLIVSWPRGAVLAAGSYEVSLSAHDHRGAALLRGARNVLATLTVRPLKRPPPATVPSLPSTGTPPPAGVPTPAETVADGAVFPVAGPHNFGGPENRFGAPRDGYTHQGQDVLTAEGTPVLAPLAGTILTTSYQAGGAGYYAVEHTGVGLDFMFAHCQAGSLAVSAGQHVAAGGTCATQDRPATRPLLTCISRCGWVAGRPPAVTRSTHCPTWKPGNASPS